jgi:hypothetical protein
VSTGPVLRAGIVVAWTNDDLPGRYLVDLTTAGAARTLAVAAAAEQALATGRTVRVRT